MEEILRLLGHLLPNSGMMFRLKIVFGGICGLGAGLLFMASGLDGALAWGAMMAACDIALIAIALRDMTRAARRGPAKQDRPA
jgi:hypothetical protein